VHISQLADRFVKDPHEIVKVGDRLQVRVLEVDTDRRRIALSARRGAVPGGDRQAPRSFESPDGQKADGEKAFTNNPFAALLGKPSKT
jgi:uncharacterized protein